MPPAPRPQGSQVGDSKFIAFLGWKKMNTKVARQNLPEDEAAWMENLQPIAPNDLQTVPGAASALSNLGAETVTRQFPANINGVDYIISAVAAGKLFATNANTGANTVISGTPGV